MKFCPKCGKRNIKGEICITCKKTEIEIEDIIVDFCRICNSYRDKSRWIKSKDILSAIQIVSKKKIKGKVKKIKILATKDDILIRKTKKIKIEIHGKEIFLFPVKIILGECSKCSKKYTKYFESILQLRNPNKEILEYIKSQFEKAESKGSFVTKEEKKKTGVDYYITKSNYAKNLAQKLKLEFGCKIVESQKLYSRNKLTSKELYRTTYLVQVPEFTKNDVIIFNAEIIKITNLGKRITGLNIKTNKKFSFNNRNLKIRKLEKKETRVIKIYPTVEVLHPETFQNVTIKNPKKLKINEKVKVVDYKGIWIV